MMSNGNNGNNGTIMYDEERVIPVPDETHPNWFVAQVTSDKKRSVDGCTD